MSVKLTLGKPKYYLKCTNKLTLWIDNELN